MSSKKALFPSKEDDLAWYGDVLQDKVTIESKGTHDRKGWSARATAFQGWFIYHSPSFEDRSISHCSDGYMIYTQIIWRKKNVNVMITHFHESWECYESFLIWDLIGWKLEFEKNAKVISFLVVFDTVKKVDFLGKIHVDMHIKSCAFVLAIEWSQSPAMSSHHRKENLLINRKLSIFCSFSWFLSDSSH